MDMLSYEMLKSYNAPKEDRRRYKESAKYVATKDNFAGTQVSEMLMNSYFGCHGEVKRAWALNVFRMLGMAPELITSKDPSHIEAFNRFISDQGITAFRLIEAYSSIVCDGHRQGFFLTKEIASDLIKTATGNVTPNDVPMPFPCFYLHLPVNAVPDNHGGHLSSIAVASALIADSVTEADAKGIRWMFITGMISGGAEDGITYQLYRPFDGSLASTGMPDVISPNVVDRDMSMIDSIKSIVVGACVYMNKPGTKEYRHAVTASQRTGQGNEFWSLRMVGEKYVAAKPCSMGGTHASPVMHLRRGHIRRVVDKVIWVRPCFVNAIE